MNTDGLGFICHERAQSVEPLFDADVLTRLERQYRSLAFDNFFLNVGEGLLKLLHLAVKFPDAQAFVPLPVPGNEVCQRRFARRWQDGVVVETGDAFLDVVWEPRKWHLVEVTNGETPSRTARADCIDDSNFAEIAKEATEKNPACHGAVSGMENDAVNVGDSALLIVHEDHTTAFAEALGSENHVALLYQIQLAPVAEITERFNCAEF